MRNERVLITFHFFSVHTFYIKVRNCFYVYFINGHGYSVVTGARTRTIYRYCLSIGLFIAGFLVDAHPVPRRGKLN